MPGNDQVIRRRKGTAVSNTYQKDRSRTQPGRLPGEITVPEQVIVSMAEIAESAKEGLLALAVGTGMQVMAAMFEEDVMRLCGPEGKAVTSVASSPGPRRTASSTAVQEVRPGSSAATTEYGQPGIICACPFPRP